MEQIGDRVINNYRSALREMLAALGEDTDLSTGYVNVVLSSMLRWAGPHQTTGVVSVLDLPTPEAWQRFLDLYHAT